MTGYVENLGKTRISRAPREYKAGWSVSQCILGGMTSADPGRMNWSQQVSEGEDKRQPGRAFRLQEQS